MKLVINKDRSVIPVGTWGTVNENNYEILDFEFPAELEHFNKRIVYYLDNERVWDAIINNKAVITNAITTKEHVKAYVWLTKTDSQYETDVDFRTQLFEMNFYENENADGIVPTEEQIDGFNTMLTTMNAKIDEVDALEQTIEAAEAQRQDAEATRVSNESTRESNESTRQTNEQTRQSQEADRERRTDEAIGNIEDKTAEYNANAEAKTTAFNNNATQKTNEFNSNYTQKVDDFNTNASSKELAFNSNASSKTSDFNSNAKTKTNAFNTNATNKTNDFNNNATEKTSEFNSNAESKTSAFNDNATQKTTNFDNNASGKTDEFNTNAQNKINEYDEHIVDYQAQIDELQEEVDELSENMPWNTTEQATEISVDDDAKYSRNKLELFGNTSQDSTTGKNLFDNSVERKNAYSGGEIGGQIAYINSNATYSYVKCAYLETGKTYTISWQQNIAPASENDRASRIIDENNINLALFNSWRSNSNSISYTPSVSGYLVLSTDINSTNIMIEEGSTATNYEPYTGGQPSPSPNYPQDIHVVTGENTLEIQGENLFDKNNFNIKSLNGGGTAGSYGQYTAATQQKHIYIPCKPNTDYVVIKDVTSVPELGVNQTSEIPAIGVSYTSLYFSSNSSGKIHVKTNASASYLDIRINTWKISQKLINKIVETLFIAEGTNVNMPYVPYYHAEYPINLGSLELCKIGDYQDYFYKENGNWYKKPNILKTNFNATTMISSIQKKTNDQAFNFVFFDYCDLSYNNALAICTHYPSRSSFVSKSIFNTYQTDTVIVHTFDDIFTSEMTVNQAKAKFHELYDDKLVFYTKMTQEPIEITDETLIAQLDEIYEHLKLVKGTNNITVTASDLKPYMQLSYMQDLKSKLDNLDSRLSLLE